MDERPLSICDLDNGVLEKVSHAFMTACETVIKVAKIRLHDSSMSGASQIHGIERAFPLTKKLNLFLDALHFKDDVDIEELLFEAFEALATSELPLKSLEISCLASITPYDKTIQNIISSLYLKPQIVNSIRDWSVTCFTHVSRLHESAIPGAFHRGLVSRHYVSSAESPDVTYGASSPPGRVRRA
eukprot:CAMPEP_0175046436 /NCGR_PEP_ID=MMETSP0052_2-20121109/5033_1 /TAXON_ID=51329 ORGANISM="Polytomella parva, Strain SAG 63-3" /NCGR_SAMPLE_ID=MMETSP0052_2 /ASSEMBLY_ACC=CAM_ASM_000194 /LENGTH=185 /DNA_ID=CAMNT_0016310189 /DNA_START=44 /DNA_END=601 /DNA_ORIENTATION=+